VARKAATTDRQRYEAADVIAGYNPDIVTLNEICLADEDFSAVKDSL
jgi:hypothetical protein